jgi:protein gp37
MRYEARKAGKKMPDCYCRPFDHVVCDDAALLGLKGTTPCTVFVASQGDLFHEKVEDDFIAAVFAAMQKQPKHRFIILTKRYDRVLRLFGNDSIIDHRPCWPNVALGFSICQNADLPAIPYRLALGVNFGMTFVCFEPLLSDMPDLFSMIERIDEWKRPKLFIVGGETGTRAEKPVALDPDWVRRIRNVAKEFGIWFYFKQWSSSQKDLWLTLQSDPPILDGHTYYELPDWFNAGTEL